MTRLFNQSWSLDRRKILRREMTGLEQILWSVLRSGRSGKKFRRQYGIGPYIVDFYLAQNHLVIEVDGDSHFSSEGIAYDKERDAFMNGVGLRVLRFTNEEVVKNLDGVLERIREAMSEHLDPTSP